ncbi:NTP transferase domain-containing protein [archaeon]|nr:NTP transferase domain-containing protein [archaeon]
MRGIILAGGKGTRLYPLTKVTNKHLLPVGREPMLYNPIKRMIEAGIKEICIVTSTEHMGDIVNLLGSGDELGVDFTYRVQEKPGGIAQALALTENFANGGKILIILGDNITKGSIKHYVDDFKKQEEGAMILLKEVGDPERYGVAAFDEKNSITNIEEKTSNPKSSFAVIGIYMYDFSVYDIIKNQRPSERGEMEITDVNNEYIKRGKMNTRVYEEAWMDAGTFESLEMAAKMLTD